MNSNYDRAVFHVLQEEGGYVDNKKDKGGETNYGISKRAYPKEDIKNLSVGRAKEIYYNDYWSALPMDKIPDSVAFCLFDIAVNCGIGRAAILLQRACNVKDDGVIGSVTLAAANSTTSLVEKLSMERIKFYQSLNDYQYFGNGWLLRALRVLRAA